MISPIHIVCSVSSGGLSREDIDGLSTYPGNFGPNGFSGAGISEVQDMLRLNLNWFCGGPELPGQLGAVVNACLAVATGLAKHVLCFRTVWESTAQGVGGLVQAGLGLGHALTDFLGGGALLDRFAHRHELAFGAAHQLPVDGGDLRFQHLGLFLQIVIAVRNF